MTAEDKKANSSTESVESVLADIRVAVSKHDLGGMEKKLGLPEKFVAQLIDDPSDWSMVVKLAVVVEATLGQAIASKFESPEMQKHLERLATNGRAGKIQFAADLGMIDAVTAARLRAMADVRNAFAHDVSVVSLTLENYVNQLPEDRAKRLFFDLIRTSDAQDSKGFDRLPGDGAKWIYWVAGCLCLLDLSRTFEVNQASNRWQQARVLMGEAFLMKQQGKDGFKAKLHEAKALLEMNLPPNAPSA